ncbi:very short patch repair endonuclease, partial [Kosakonia cowanii]
CFVFKVPASRTVLWFEMIGIMVAREARDCALLLEQGWGVMVVWEWALRGKLKLSVDALSVRVEEWICVGHQTGQIDT